MRADELSVEVRDGGLNRVGTILPKDLTLEVNAVHNNVGDWKVTLPSEHPMCEYLRQPGSGIIVTYGDFVFSGPTVQPQETVTVEDIAGSVTFAGMDDNVVLADMLAWPNPLDVDGTGDGSITGKAETIIRTVVNENIGPGALTERRKAGLVLDGTDLARGSTITKYRQFQTILTLLQEIATPDDLGFRVVQRSASLSFEMYEVTDRSAAVRLSISNGEVAAQKIATAAPEATHAIVVGQGWATSKKAIDYSTTDSLNAEAAWGRRIEKYVDQKTTNVTAELQRAGLEVLTDAGSTLVGVEITPAEDSSLTFGQDWFLGDKVGVEVSGEELAMRANGVAIRAGESGTRVGMTMGDDLAFADSDGSRTLAGIATRVDALEKASGELAVTTSDTDNQVIISGKATCSIPASTQAGSFVVVNFPSASYFASTPEVVATVNANSILVCTIASISTSAFQVRIMWSDGSTGHSAATGIQVNWIAMGTKA